MLCSYPSPSAYSDGEGRFFLATPSQPFRGAPVDLVAARPNVGRSRFRLESPAPEETWPDVTIVLEPGVEVRGRILDSDGVTLSGIAFSLPQNRVAWISDCAGALIANNSFGGLMTPGTPDAYLHLDDVTDASIVHNHFAATHCLALSLTSSAGTKKVFVCGNKFPRGCGVGGNPWVASGYTLTQCNGSQGNPVF